MLDKLVALHRKNGNPDYFADLYNLATVNYEMGLFADAKIKYLECLDFCDAKRFSSRYLDTSLNLALCHSGLGEYDLAKPRLGECLKIAGHLGDKALIADIRYNIGKTLYLNDELEAAVSEFSGLISDIKSSPEKYCDEMFLADCHNSLGYCYEKKGNFSAASACFNRAMKVIKACIGESNEEYLSCMYYFAQYNALNKKYAAAARSYKISARLIKKIAAEDSAYYTDVMNRIADISAMLGELDKSLFYRLKSLRLMKRQIGENHIYYANNLKNVSLIYREKNIMDKAADFLLRSVKIKERILGVANMDCVRDTVQLCGLYVERFEYDHAADMLQKTANSLKGEGGRMKELADEIGSICTFLRDRRNASEPPRDKDLKKDDDLIERLKNVESRMNADKGLWS